MSKARELLERIAKGEISFGPSDRTEAALKSLQSEAEEIKEALDWLIDEGFLGAYKTHPITYAGDGTWIDLILIKGELTRKGQDRSQWPD